MDDHTRDELRAWIDGTLPPAEAALVAKRMAGDDEARAYVESHRIVWDALGDAFTAEVARTPVDPAPIVHRAQVESRGRQRFRRRWGVAAALVLAASIWGTLKAPGAPSLGPGDHRVVHHLHLLQSLDFLEDHGAELDLAGEFEVLLAFEGEVEGEGMSRTLVLMALVLTALGATRLVVTDAQLQRNRRAWEAMDGTERDAMRAAWARYEGATEEERRVLLRRLGTAGRLAQGLRDPDTARPVDPTVLAEVLSQLDTKLRHQLQVPEEVALVDEIRSRTRREITAFLDNMVEADRLSVEERDAIGRMPWPASVQRALELQKREEIFLYVEGVAPQGGPLLMELSTLEPLDVLERMRDRRRLRGFLGRAERLLELSADERRQLASADEKELFRRLKILMEPKVRELLEARGLPAERIEMILRKPVCDLERYLNRLLSEPP